jgi:hypothetical protein
MILRRIASHNKRENIVKFGKEKKQFEYYRDCRKKKKIATKKNEMHISNSK